MAIIIDIVIVAIIALCLFLGYRRGLTGSLLKILSFVLAIVIAFILFKPVSNLVINHTNWDDSLKTSIEQFITEKTSTPEEKSSLPQVIVDYIDETMAQSVNEAKEVAIENTAQSVTNLIVNAGVWIAVFIIARILLIFIRFITALIAKLPVINQFDKLGGILYWILEAFVILYVLLAIISFIAPMINNAEFIDALNKSFIGSMLYNNNILLKILF